MKQRRQLGEQPRVSLVAHVREIGEIEDGGDLKDKGSAGGTDLEKLLPNPHSNMDIVLPQRKTEY